MLGILGLDLIILAINDFFEIADLGLVQVLGVVLIFFEVLNLSNEIFLVFYFHSVQLSIFLHFKIILLLVQN